MSEERKRGFGIGSLLVLIGSVMVMVSPSLVWFREEMKAFGLSLPSITVKGSELGELSELMSLAGKSIFARGEYVVMLGAFALILALAYFFVRTRRNLMASLIGIAAVATLVMGIEPTAKLIGGGTSLGEGVYLLFVGSIFLLIGAAKLPAGVSAEPEKPLAPLPTTEVPVSLPPTPAAVRPSDTIPRPVVVVDDVIASRNRLVGVAIGLIILAIFSGVAFRLPGASTHIAAGLFVGDVIKLVIAAIMLILVMPARLRLASVITHYARQVFKVDQPARTKVAANIDGLSVELANVIIIAIVWPIVVQVVDILLLLHTERDFGWISILVTLGFVALLLYRLYKGYGLLTPVLAAIGKAPQEVSCTKCGSLNSASAKFCLSCGAELQPKPAEKVQPLSLHCPKCGAENSPGAKFCQSCGAPLLATK